MVGVLQTFALFNSLEKVERKGFGKRRGEGKGREAELERCVDYCRLMWIHSSCGGPMQTISGLCSCTSHN